MTRTAYNWDALEKRIKKTRLLFLFYIVSGIILLILSGSHLQLKTLIMSVIYPILFGSLLGFINHRYQTVIYKREIGFWQALAMASSDIISISDIVSIIGGTFRGIKWYSWLFHFLMSLLLVVGVIIQLFILLPPGGTRFTIAMFLISSMLLIVGSFFLFAFLTAENIIAKIRSTQLEDQ